MEMLIAMALLVLLGGGLVTILRQGVSIWSTAESRGLIYEQARALLELIESDLRSTAVRFNRADDDVWVRFIADRYVHPDEEQGAQRLRFVRTIAGEMADPILRQGGRRVSTKSPVYYDGGGLSEAARRGLLKAPAGLMEVFYMHDPRPGVAVVWRGVRAPLGGPASLFVDANVEPSVRPLLGPDRRGAESSDGEEERFYLERFAVPVADHILYLGFRFWTATTNTWESVPTLARAGPDEQSGPSRVWDSTRALISEKEGNVRTGTFFWKRRRGSLDDARDDVFPEFVEVTIVIEGEEQLLGPRLSERLTSKGTTLTLSTELRLPDDGSQRMVLVDGEWIAIKSSSGCTLAVADKGRGWRGTVPAAHDRGARVVTGVSFRRVLALPSFRGDLHPPASQRRSLRSNR